ncbi:MAG TPA: NADPH-dependent F420 reductase [Anaerolineales bacterium]|nr:NADPH-dependent F420 reductase [Anaerolineales bacterium]
MTKPTIAVLGGTGKEGPGLALRWAHNGYEVLIGSRQTEKAEAAAADLNENLGGRLVRGFENGEAARRADISVLTVQYQAHRVALESLKDALQGKILVDATARVDFRDPQPPPAPSAGRIAQEILGSGARVVAALQTVPAHALKHGLGEPLDFDVLVCADDLPAAETVMDLIEGADMRAFYAGSLDNAVVVEGLPALLISLNKHYRVRTASIRVTGL